MKSATSKTPKSTFSFQNSQFRFNFFFDQNLDFVLGTGNGGKFKRDNPNMPSLQTAANVAANENGGSSSAPKKGPGFEKVSQKERKRQEQEEWEAWEAEQQADDGSRKIEFISKSCIIITFLVNVFCALCNGAGVLL